MSSVEDDIDKMIDTMTESLKTKIKKLFIKEEKRIIKQVVAAQKSTGQGPPISTKKSYPQELRGYPQQLLTGRRGYDRCDYKGRISRRGHRGYDSDETETD